MDFLLNDSGAGNHSELLKTSSLEPCFRIRILAAVMERRVRHLSACTCLSIYTLRVDQYNQILQGNRWSHHVMEHPCLY